MRTADRLIVVGFRRWRQGALLPILRTRAHSLHFVSDIRAAAALSPGPSDELLCWGMPVWLPELEQLAVETGARSIRLEDGFYRSVGLGSDLIPPRSLVFDDLGIYFDPTRPSRLETILATAVFTPDECARATELRHFIVGNGLSKYNLGAGAAAAPDWRTEARGRPVILVPGQVEDDASVRWGGGGLKSNEALLEAVRAARPDAFIVYRPHPDVLAGNREGGRPLQNVVDAGGPLHQVLDAVDEVHTLTSLTGFDALLRGLPVVTYGMPFYAGWGLTADRNMTPDVLLRRNRNLVLDELVSGVLLHYPAYWNWADGRWCGIEETLRGLVRDREHHVPGGTWRRLLRKTSALITAAARLMAH